MSWHRRTRRVAALLAAATILGACSGSDPGPAAGTTTTEPTAAADRPDPAAPVTVSVASEQEVDRAFRQGLAKTPDGWAMSTNFSLFLTDDAFARTLTVDAAIPPEWVAKGYDHLGDPDVVGDVLVVPAEQPDYDLGTQAMLRFDIDTLEYLGGTEVAQSHNAWVAFDPEQSIAYSMSGFTDDTVLPYVVNGDTWSALDPIRLSDEIGRVQGGDVADGALWLSTDDEDDGVYRVDLATGTVERAGSIGHVESEGEGFDATVLPSGDLHVLTAGASLGPVLLVHLDIDAAD